jgi:uncharacterized membrane protein YeaQ/YmgE (transglycosylase-associated protein family)
MLEGINVLNQYWAYPQGWEMLGVFGIIGAVVCIIITILHWAEYNKFNWKLIVGAVVCACLSICGWVLRDNNKRQEYKVTISDSVDFNEFTSKYNVISHEGKIYTIIEKEEK